jgi:hypothetical protein
MAGYPVAPGSTSLSGNYIPEIWSGRLLIKFYERTVLAQIANTWYEGEITAFGDKVNIRTLPDITIRDYTIDQKLVTTKPVPTTVELLIDQGKYYSLPVNDVELKQSDIKYVDEWADDAAKQMKIEIETDIYGDIYSDADSTNAGNTAGAISGDIALGVSGAPKVITRENITDYIVDCGQALDENNIPDEDRFMILPAWACNYLKTSDLKNADLTGDDKSPLRTGLLGMVDRFSLYQSNLLNSQTDGSYTTFDAMFGQKSALTFASQLTKNEIVDNQDDFGKLARGLQVYGYKVIKGTALGHAYIAKG